VVQILTSTVKPRYLATFRPGHNFGERRGGDLTRVTLNMTENTRGRRL